MFTYSIFLSAFHKQFSVLPLPIHNQPVEQTTGHLFLNSVAKVVVAIGRSSMSILLALWIAVMITLVGSK